ncbi:zinc ribbon domain-containing protein [Candidatus Lokiarchaeum ossiferum]|uniref:zinc ribbon domain-containing protein n=1 Tax=Candidatus Lokiarchaeum ossiferum TaxID=2951803 RepID=UPI00352F0864
MYPTFIIDVLLIIGFIFYLVFLFKGYKIFHLGPNCEKTFFKQFLFFLVLEFLWVIANALKYILVYFEIYSSGVDHYYSPYYYVYDVVNRGLGIFTLLTYTYFTFKIDSKLLYSLTEGKLGRGILISMGVSLLAMFAYFPLFGLVISILTIIIMFKLRKGSKITPKTRIYSRILGFGLFLYTLAKLGFRFLSWDYSYYGLSRAFSDYSSYSRDPFILIRTISVLIYVLSLIFLGLGVIRTSYNPYYNAKNRSIYGFSNQNLDIPAISKQAAQYQFGSPNISFNSMPKKPSHQNTNTPLINKEPQQDQKQNLGVITRNPNVSYFSPKKIQKNVSSFKLCPNCNISLETDVKFCPKCGKQDF